jgi:hypothetical protein
MIMETNNASSSDNYVTSALIFRYVVFPWSVCVNLYASQNKELLFPYAALDNWPCHGYRVFSAQYELKF